MPLVDSTAASPLPVWAGPSLELYMPCITQPTASSLVVVILYFPLPYPTRLRGLNSSVKAGAGCATCQHKLVRSMRREAECSTRNDSTKNDSTGWARTHARTHARAHAVASRCLTEHIAHSQHYQVAELAKRVRQRSADFVLVKISARHGHGHQ
jgi:hypothetical protein